jgi:hypothetical protein
MEFGFDCRIQQAIQVELRCFTAKELRRVVKKQVEVLKVTDSSFFLYVVGKLQCGGFRCMKKVELKLRSFINISAI